LWQAGCATGLELQHLGTRVTPCGDPHCAVAGQTLWGGRSADGRAGVAWDWVQVSLGVVAMSDPLSVITNLRLLGDEGEVLTSWQAARYLNQIVHALPWQNEVARALQARH
jgi:hypothetical protein